MVLFNWLTTTSIPELIQSSCALVLYVCHLGWCFKEELTNEELKIQHVEFAAFGCIHVPDLFANG